MLTCGKCALMSRSSSSYHSSGRCGMQPALHQDLIAAQRDRLVDLLRADVAVEHVAFGVAWACGRNAQKSQTAVQTFV